MASNESFGFDPEDFDRVLRGAGEQLRGVMSQLGQFVDGSGRPGWSTLFADAGRRGRPAPEPETTGDRGDGVWVIYAVDSDGGARVEQVFGSELDALRAHRHNTDSSRAVRFLPYGMPVSVLDGPEDSPTTG